MDKEQIIKDAENLIEDHTISQGHHRRVLQNMASRDGGLNPASRRLAVRSAIVSCEFAIKSQKLLRIDKVYRGDFWVPEMEIERLEGIKSYLEGLL